MADFADVVEEIKKTNSKLDTLAQATDPKGAAAAEDKREIASKNDQKISYLKTIADAVSGVKGDGLDPEDKKKGGLLAGIGGALSGLGIGAGAAMGGLGALFAGGGYLLKQLSEFDGKAVKENILELIGIADDLKGNSGSLLAAFGDTGLLIFTLGGIGAGLAVFSVGAGVAAAIEKFTGDIEWSQAIKDNIETLLSIDTKSALDTVGLAATMLALSAGVLAFSLGSAAGAAATGIDDAISMFTGDKEGQGTDWAAEIKKNMEMLLTIDTGNTIDALNIAGTMAALGLGLIAFSFGSVAGAAATGINSAISMFTGDKEGMGTGWAAKIKTEVEMLLSIQTGSILDTVKLVAALGGIGLGLIVFSLGKVVATGAEAAASSFSPSEKERKDGMDKF